MAINIVTILLALVIVQEIQIIFLQHKINKIEQLFTDLIADKIQQIFMRAYLDDEDDEENTGA